MITEAQLRGSRRRPIPWGFAELMLTGAVRRGADPGRILQRVGLTASPPPAFLSEAEFASLLRCISRVTGDEFWGLASEPLPLGGFEAICRSAARARTLDAALRSASRVLRLLLRDVVVRLSREADSAVVTISPRPAWPATSESALIFLIYGLGCWLVGNPLPVQGVDVRGGPSPHDAALTRYYRAPLNYDRPRTRLLMPADVLELPIAIDARRLETFITTAPLGLVVRYRDPLSMAERLRGVLQRRPGGPSDLQTTARSLAVTPQTLHRRLAAEGFTFQGLRDEVRRDLAIELLADARKSLDEIALMLGFAEHSSFHRAFRRWTGMSPGVFRPSRPDPR